MHEPKSSFLLECFLLYPACDPPPPSSGYVLLFMSEEKGWGGFMCRMALSVSLPYEHSEQARAPHTHELRDVLRYVALSLLQKPLHNRGIHQNLCPALV
jgi:hypothetical protein